MLKYNKRFNEKNYKNWLKKNSIIMNYKKMNILEYFAFVENDIFLNFIIVYFTIGIYPFIDFMTPIFLICLEGSKLFISWTLALYLFGNLRDVLRIAYFVKQNEEEIKLLEKNNIGNIEEKEIETEEINNNEVNSELEQDSVSKENVIKENKDMKENFSWDLDFSIEKLE